MDVQLFLTLPFLALVAFAYPRLGLTLCTGLLTLSVTLAGVEAYNHNWNASFLEPFGYRRYNDSKYILSLEYHNSNTDFGV